MPEAPAAPPSAPAAAPAAPAPSGQTGVPIVNLSPVSTTPGNKIRSPAMQRAMQSLHKATGEPAAPAKAPAALEPPKPAAAKPAAVPPAAEPDSGETTADPGETPSAQPDKTGSQQGVEPAKAATAPEQDTLTPEEKKSGPWQITQKYKRANKALEREVADLRKKVQSAGEAATLQTRLEQAEAQLKEAHEKLAFIDYQQDPEFKSKYVEPFERAWVEMGQLASEITIETEDGQTRFATVQDIAPLVNMTTTEAIRKAKEMFGDDVAPLIIQKREEIRRLYHLQQSELERAKKTSLSKKQEQSAAMQRVQQEATKLWVEFGEKDAESNPLLQPKDGDKEWNEKLTKSSSYVDEAWKLNPFDPSINSEERAKRVRAHANIRSRAKAYPMLVVELTRAKAQIEALQQELSAFKAGEPGPGVGRTAEPTTPTAGTLMEQKKADLRRRAK